jgi:hypothetical protein
MRSCDRVKRRILHWCHHPRWPSGRCFTHRSGGRSAGKGLAMTAELSEGLKQELRVGASTLDVLPELRDRVAHLVVFTEAAERAARDVFDLVQRIRVEEAEDE